MTISLDFDFTQREYTVTFITFWDIFAEIGGLKAAIMPLVQLFVPFWILFFLISLSHIIKDASAEKAKLEFIELLHVSARQFKMIQMLKDPHFAPDLNKALNDVTNKKIDEKNVEQMLKMYHLVLATKNYLEKQFNQNKKIQLLLAPIDMAKSRYEFMKARSQLTPL